MPLPRLGAQPSAEDHALECFCCSLKERRSQGAFLHPEALLGLLVLSPIFLIRVTVLQPRPLPAQFCLCPPQPQSILPDEKASGQSPP